MHKILLITSLLLLSTSGCLSSLPVFPEGDQCEAMHDDSGAAIGYCRHTDSLGNIVGEAKTLPGNTIFDERYVCEPVEFYVAILKWRNDVTSWAGNHCSDVSK